MRWCTPASRRWRITCSWSVAKENEMAAVQAMRIGLDFDNTIIRYDDVFLQAARDRGLLGRDFVGTKQQIRDTIRALPGGEVKWQALQGYVYGSGIGGAALFPG